MQIQLFDTLTRSKRILQASDGKQFRFYCCGPTVYGAAHIGNFRTFLVQDVLRRLLEVYGLNPFHVRNLTDVDDKTIRRSQEENMTLAAFTQKWTQYFHEDCARFNMLKPIAEPSAVEFIPQQIKLIEQLVESGHAYVAHDGSVYYKVCAFHEYGKLAHLDRETLKTQHTNSAGTTNLADEYERESIADFALWKAYKPEDGANHWNSPWGKGRPGWHIECSAMSMHYFGETMDLHGGGIDLCFPHHENEIAQSEAVTKKTFSNHWFHVAHLKVEGQKMSKSLGNLFTLKDLEERGYSARILRYLLVSGHYHQPLNFTFEGLGASRSALHKIIKSLESILTKVDMPFEVFCKEYITSDHLSFKSWKYTSAIWNAISDDLNTSEAIGELFKALKAIQEDSTLKIDTLKEELNSLGSFLYVLGIDLLGEYLDEKQHQEIKAPSEIEALAKRRWESKQARDFDEADQLRQQLLGQGWIVHDSKEGYRLEKQ